MNKYFLILWIIILPLCLVKAQSLSISKLKQQTSSEYPDSVRITALGELGSRYIQTNLDSSQYYKEQLERFAIEKGNKKAKVLTLYLKSGYLIHKRKLLEARDVIDTAIVLAKEVNDQAVLGRIYNVAAMNFHALNDSQNTIANFINSLKHTEKSKEKHRIPIIIGNLGYAHFKNNNIQLAEKYFNDVMYIADSLDDIRLKSFSRRNLGMLKAHKKEYTAAKENYSMAIEFSQSQNDLYNEGYTRLQLGNLHTELKASLDAESEYKNALSLFTKLGNVEHQIETYVELLKLYNDTGRYNQTINTAAEALDLISKNESTDIKKRFFEVLATAHAKKGDYKKAYQFHKEYKSWADSVFSIEKANKALELESKHQLEKKEISIKKLNSEKSMILNQSKLYNLIYLLCLGVISLLTLYFWSIYKAKKSHSQTLEQEVKNRTSELESKNYELISSNNELEKFAYITSHDLKEPLRNINSFSELTVRAIKEKKLPAAIEHLEFIKSNSNQMNNLIEDVLDYSKLKMPIENADIDLIELIEEVKETLSTLIHEKHPQIIVNSLPVIFGNRFQYFQLFKNLIENGIKYNKSNPPTITIDGSIKDDLLLLSFVDNGIGIDASYHQEIFSMFKRLHTKSEYSGSGLGLATVKKVVDGLKGKISLESKLGSGSTFKISIPYSNNH